MAADRPTLTARFRIARDGFAVDVELACPPGITCVMGPSGAGKTTVLAVLAGLAEPERGRVALGDEVWLDRADGRDRAPGVPVHARRLGYVFQGLALFPHRTAQQNVEYGIAAASRADRAARARRWLERVGVGHLGGRLPRTFSGGEAQRVALARALASDPRVVLLDEPYSALDRELRAQLVELERGLAAELGVPIVHVTHSVPEVRRLADQVVRLDRGRVVAHGGAEEVLAGVAVADE